MPDLRWLTSSGAEIPGGTCVKHGKEILLSGDGYESIPEAFAVHRRFGFLLRRYRERRGMPITAPVGKPQPAAEIGPAAAQKAWVLPSPGRRAKWRLFFTDDVGNASDEIHVSRIGAFGAPNPTAFGFGLGIPFEFTAAIDPELELSVLTPWGAGETDFRAYLDELAEEVRGEGEDRAEARAALSEFLAEYLPSAPPQGWEFEVELTEFALDDGESVKFPVNVHTPTPGAVAFALQMSGVIEGEEMAVVSDPMVVRLPDDGSQEAELLGGDDSEGGGFGAEKPKPAEVLSAAEAGQAAV